MWKVLKTKKLQISARQKPPSVQKSDAPKERVPQVKIIQGRFLNSALGPFLWVFLVERFQGYPEGPEKKEISFGQHPSSV